MCSLMGHPDSFMSAIRHTREEHILGDASPSDGGLLSRPLWIVLAEDGWTGRFWETGRQSAAHDGAGVLIAGNDRHPCWPLRLRSRTGLRG